MIGMHMHAAYLLFTMAAILAGIGFAVAVERKTGRKTAPLMIASAMVLVQAYVTYYDFSMCADIESLAKEPFRFLFQAAVLLLAFACAVKQSSAGGFRQELAEYKLSYRALLLQLAIIVVWLGSIVLFSLQPALLRLLPEDYFFVTGFLIKLSGWLLCAFSALRAALHIRKSGAKEIQPANV